MKMIQRLKSKKGFSLVELLIVIAIMAVLVGVLAPQYLRYVERSRTSTDIQTANAIANAMQTTIIEAALDDIVITYPLVVTWTTATGAILAESPNTVGAGGLLTRTLSGRSNVNAGSRAAGEVPVVTFTFASNTAPLDITYGGVNNDFTRGIDRILLST